MDNLDPLDHQENGVSKGLQAVQETLDHRAQLDLPERQVLQGPTASRVTRVKLVWGCLVPEERGEIQAPEERKAVQAWTERGDQRVLQESAALGERRERTGCKVTKERRGTRCW